MSRCGTNQGDSVNTRKRLVAMVLALTVAVAAAGALEEDDIQQWFQDLGSDIAQHVTGSLVIWQIQGGPLLDQGITDLFLDTELQLALSEQLSGSRARWIYNPSLTEALDAETAVGTLEVGNVDPAGAVDELDLYGFQVDHLLHLRFVTHNQQIGMQYRVLELETGALAWAGVIWESGGPSELPALVEIAETVSDGRDGRFVPLIVQRPEGDEAELFRALVAVELARSYPGRVLPFDYYSRTLVGSLDGSDATEFSQGSRALFLPLKDGLAQIQADGYLTVQRVAGSTIGSLIDAETAQVYAHEIRGGDAEVLAELLADSVARMSADSATFGRVRVLPVAASGITALNASAQRALRTTIQAQLAPRGIAVIDFETVEALQGVWTGVYAEVEEWLGGAAESEVKSILDPAGLHMYVAREGLVRGAYTSVREPRLAEFIQEVYRGYAADSAPESVGVLSVEGAALDGLADASKLAMHLFVAEQLYRLTPVRDPSQMIQSVSESGIAEKLRSELPDRISAIREDANLPQVALRISMVDAAGGQDLHLQVVDLSTSRIELSRAILLSSSISQDIARGLAPQLGDLPSGLTCMIAPVASIPATAAPNGLRRRLESVLNEQLGWSILTATPAAGDNPRAREIAQAAGGAIMLQPFFWQVQPGEFALLLRVVDFAAGQSRVTNVITVYFDQAGRVGSFAPVAPAVEAALDTVAGVVARGSVVKIFAPSSRIAGTETGLFSTLAQARVLAVGAELVDTPFPSGTPTFGTEEIVYMLGADTYVLPFSYTGRSVGVRAYDAQGYLTALRLPTDDDTRMSFVQENPPALSAVESVRVVPDFTLEQSELSVDGVQDAILAELLAAGSREVVDRINSGVFLSVQPESAAHTVEVAVADAPFYGTSNPTVEVRVRETTGGDRPLVWASSAALPETERTLRPGSYIRVDLDYIAEQVADRIRSARIDNGIDVVRIRMEPTAITLDAEPNRILRERFADPVRALIDKTAAALHQREPGRYLVYDYPARGLPSGETFQVEVTLTQVEEIVNAERYVYRQAYNGTCRIMGPNDSLALARLEEPGEIPELNIRERMLVFQFRLLANLDEWIARGERYAESGRLEDLRGAHTQAQRVAEQITELEDAVAARSERIARMNEQIQELERESGLQTVINEAVRAMGNKNYREAQRVLKSAQREFGDSEAIADLLEEAENLERNVITFVRHPEGQSFDPEPAGTSGLTEFALEGEIPVTPAPQFIDLSFTNTGIFRIARVEGDVRLDVPAEHALQTDSGTYLIADSTREPVLLTVHPAEGAGDNPLWRVELDRDNEVLYRAFPDNDALEATFPAIAVDYDVEMYKVRRRRVRASVGWTVTGILSGAAGAGAWWLATNLVVPELDAAMAQYDAARTSLEAESLANRVTWLRRGAVALQVTNWVGYGLGGLGVTLPIVLLATLPKPPDLHEAQNLFAQ